MRLTLILFTLLVAGCADVGEMLRDLNESAAEMTGRYSGRTHAEELSIQFRRHSSGPAKLRP